MPALTTNPIHLAESMEMMVVNGYGADYTDNAAGLAGSWVLGFAATDQNAANIQHGALYPYLKSVGVYHCPTDRSTVQGMPGLLRFRSYSLSGHLNSEASLNGVGPSPLTKTTQINHPAKVFGFLDEHEASIDDGTFGIYQMATNLWVNLPSDRHTKGLNLTFVDGHAERWRWLWPKVYTAYYQATANSLDQTDLNRLQYALPEAAP